MKPTAGLPPMIPFDIPAYWTAEEALAVFELLDELRQRVWGHYQLQLLDLLPEPHPAAPPDPGPVSDDDDFPF